MRVNWLERMSTKFASDIKQYITKGKFDGRVLFVENVYESL